MRAREAADALLAAFATQLEALGVEVPERRAIVPGRLPVWDGEQFSVALQEIMRGQPGRPEAMTTWPVPTVSYAQFQVALVRVVPALHDEGPVGSMIPTAQELGEGGDRTLSDAEALVDAALEIQEAQTVTEHGMGFAIGPCSTLGPEGGMAATALLVTVSLD